jgi:hypothetical protein
MINQNTNTDINDLDPGLVEPGEQKLIDLK